MLLPITEPILERLRAIRVTQLQHPYADEVLTQQEVIVLTLGLGPAIYLRFDGRVLIWHYMDDEPLRETDDVGDIAAGIVIGARNSGFDGLLSLLPQMPSNGTVCDTCCGTHWWSFPRQTNNKKPGEIVCPTCRGLGWTVESPR
ncbi:MAG: hypothetical protein C0467_08355 [Planctomycetaceae bacterium]|nr:hypothetical protein [Planctomycetaceae bacterium]